MTEHHQQIAAVLRRIRSRWRVSVALRAWTRASAAAATVLAVAFVAHRLVDLAGTPLAALWGSAAALAVGAIAFFLLPLRKTPTDAQLARYVEERCPELEDTLATAIAERERGDASPLRALVDADAANRARTLDLDRVVSASSLRRAAGIAGAATGALVGAAALSVGPAWEAVQAMRARPPAPLVEELTETTGVEPPRVTRIDVHYAYPHEFGMAPRVEEDGGDIYAPAGTRVRLAIHTDRPATAGALTLPEGERLSLRRDIGGSPANVLFADLTIQQDASYRVALKDETGAENPGDTEYFIRTLHDSPPDVRIILPGSDRPVTPIEEVAIEAKAEDDFGIAALDLVFSVRGGRERTVPFRRSASGPVITGEQTIYLEDLGVRPGDFVSYYARARDVSRGKRSSEARSDIFFLEVKPFEEEFVAAQSGAGTGAGQGRDNSLETLIAGQKDVITATWRLDRRSRDSGGRPGDDIRSVGRAQAELRRRAGASGRSGGSMQKAIEAMDGAHAQLEALDTTTALPHEMTALNELLRAQAEIRRREVQRQQANSNSAGAGSNRQTQDLSSLFDRELARQQTNYETPTTAETRERKKDEGEDALEKIRELARRQEALNREQDQAVRDQMSEEERQRTLERLTREQSELRRQAEELSRQVQRGNPAGGSGQTARALQQASQDMQSAASGLRRRNQNDAAASGKRALDRLRETEQQMRGARAGDERRQDQPDGASPDDRRSLDQLARARELRERLEAVDRQLVELQREGRGRGAGESRGREQRDGRGRGEGEAQGRGRGRSPGQAGRTSGGWEEARELVEAIRGDRDVGTGARDLGGFNPGLSAPGTEAWKQDFARWEQLKVQLAAALEKLESNAAARLRERHAKDRLNAGASQAVPEKYRELVDKYYRALAAPGR